MNSVPPKDTGQATLGRVKKHVVYRANSNSGDVPTKTVVTGCTNPFNDERTLRTAPFCEESDNRDVRNRNHIYY